MTNFKTVFYTLGILQIILGLSMLLPVSVQFIYGEFDSSFVGPSLITIVFGCLFFLANQDHQKKN